MASKSAGEGRSRALTKAERTEASTVRPPAESRTALREKPPATGNQLK
jgi:hypothetical protein